MYWRGLKESREIRAENGIKDHRIVNSMLNKLDKNNYNKVKKNNDHILVCIQLVAFKLSEV